MKVHNLLAWLYLVDVTCALPSPPISDEIRDTLNLLELVPFSGDQVDQLLASLETMDNCHLILQIVKYHTIPASFIPLLVAGYVFFYKKEDPTTLMLAFAALAPVNSLVVYKLAKHLMNKSVETHCDLIDRLTKNE